MGTDIQMTGNCGIYSITNTVNGHVYIGSAVNISRRWNDHVRHLNKNEHHSIHLQNAWILYGADCFEFSIREHCEIENLIEREQFYIDSEKPSYNICQTAGSCLGRKHTEEFKRKCSETHKGNTYWLGRKHTEEAKRKMSEAQKGNTYALGYKHTEEQKRKNSEAQKGNTSALGYKRPEESKRKYSEAGMGHVVTEETRRKISEANKRYWEKRRAALNVDVHEIMAL
jgi:hypothetical protein